MRCLLCNDAVGPMQRVRDGVWTFTCADCGTYQFDQLFGHFVSRARARQWPLTIRTLRALGRCVAQNEEPLFVTMTLYDVVVHHELSLSVADAAVATGDTP